MGPPFICESVKDLHARHMHETLAGQQPSDGEPLPDEGPERKRSGLQGVGDHARDLRRAGLAEVRPF